MSASSGVRRLMRSKSSSTNSTPASRATASRWRTAFVEPPVAITAAIAFSRPARVMIARGRTPSRSSSHRAPSGRPRDRAALGSKGRNAGRSGR